MAKIRETTNHGQRKLEVDFGLVAGRRRRVFVETMAEARHIIKGHERRRKEIGDAWLLLPAREQWTVFEILDEIRREGLTLGEVWGFWRDSHAVNRGVVLADAVEQFLTAKREAGRRGKYMDEIARALGKFAEGRAHEPIASITVETIRAYIAQFDAAATRQTVQSRLSTLFSWAYRQQMIVEDPCKRLETIRVDQGAPEILSVDECRRLVLAALEIDKGFLPYLGLALFLGIRPDECHRLEPDAVDLKNMTVTVSGEAAKTRNRRIVSVNEPAYRLFVAGDWETGWRTNFRRRRDAIRERADIKHWPKDVMRHTAASHFYNVYGIDEATKQLGHSAAIMLRHYRQLVSKEETAEWLAI